MSESSGYIHRTIPNLIIIKNVLHLHTIYAYTCMHVLHKFYACACIHHAHKIIHLNIITKMVHLDVEMYRYSKNKPN